ncbi:NAD(P)/FAD-dependent oxidoreductase [Nonomuraea sp. NEAU-A123]|uniref:NAD(P)/FAD-dependent oxidoreductase n=1 Tax=Nonomuraea sp. NEAU-A123 TaxID=2839649 RepID=UPI001BE4534D|nr:NAD(P)/FAD-dependent oxidoreductase [Nonomuraea sp. NEAU-A123]MBT2225711.1 NAD(P)/FAD-dependent oxidoreductase [Nonomuraea sp. NEAU-A123]
MTDADVVIVGARCAGSAAAIALARAGRKVIAVDSARFPSPTISTHLMWPGGLAELARLGALDRVAALGAPRLPLASVEIPGVRAVGGYSAVDGISYALCVRRAGLDLALVETARAAGAEVREGTRVTGLLSAEGRVAGVEVNERGGRSYALRAPVVVGADGRRSTVARLVGAADPYLSRRDGRACYYAYFADPHEPLRAVASQWRQGAELGTAFPCDGGLTLVLLMPPDARTTDFRKYPEKEYDRTIDELLPGLGERLRGCARRSRVFGAAGLESYFRVSAGPGWALVGDAGHFKDPVTAQGIRDALRFGRLLGESLAGLPDLSAGGVDAVLAQWERRRDRECLEAFYWTDRTGRADPVGPLDVEMHRALRADPALMTRFLDIYSRIIRPAEALTTPRLAGWTARALLRSGTDRPALLRFVARTVRELQQERKQVNRRLLRYGHETHR